MESDLQVLPPKTAVGPPTKTLKEAPQLLRCRQHPWPVGPLGGSCREIRSSSIPTAWSQSHFLKVSLQVAWMLEDPKLCCQAPSQEDRHITGSARCFLWCATPREWQLQGRAPSTSWTGTADPKRASDNFMGPAFVTEGVCIMDAIGELALARTFDGLSLRWRPKKASD